MPETQPNEHQQCLVCGSSSLKQLPAYQKDYLVKCRKCSFVFCKRIPTRQELSDHYDGYPRGGAISPITIQRYHELLDQFEPFRKTSNLIDVGCGDGYFLAEAKERGWTVYGTEFTDEAMAICSSKGIAMQQGPLDSSRYPVDFFDVITSFEVIEHINNPIEELGHFSAILRHGGLLYITTPNFNSMSRAMLGAQWNIIEYPEHLSYYTTSTLTRLLRQKGFHKKKAITTGISVRRFKASSGMATPAGNSDEALREKTETKLHYRLAKNAINGFLKLTRSGDNLKGFFIHSKP